MGKIPGGRGRGEHSVTKGGGWDEQIGNPGYVASVEELLKKVAFIAGVGF